MIKELFSAGDIDPNMLIALCSALHFKGCWETPFDAPFEDEFHLTGEKTVKTQLRFAFNWCPELNAQIVELPYTNGTQMILLVPKYHDGLADVEKSLNDEKLRKLCETMDRSGEDEVEV